MSRVKGGHQETTAQIQRRNLSRFYTVFILLLFCILFYYAGEIIDFFGWDAIRWDFFYSVHDIHRMLFLAPIVYAGYFFGVKAAMIILIIALSAFMPRALFISPFPDPMLRMLLFVVVAGVIGYLTGRESEQRKRLETLVRKQSDATLSILDEMEDGVLIIGADYKIRFLNRSIISGFGDGVGIHCYSYLHKLDKPCRDVCKLPSVVKGTTEKFKYVFPDGKKFEVLAVPYVDSDGTVCQLTILRDITLRAKS